MKENYQVEMSFLQRSVFSKLILAMCITIISAYIPIIVTPISAVVGGGGSIGLSIVKFIAIISVLTFASNKMVKSDTKGLKLFWFTVIPIIIGIVSSSIFIYYSLGSIITVFIISSIYFTALYFYSKVSTVDFTKYSSVLTISLFSIILALIFNIIIGSSVLNIILSIIIIVIFTFYTIKDGQEMVKFVENNTDYEYEKVFEEASYEFAINLYLDFINLFMNLLDLFGR